MIRNEITSLGDMVVLTQGEYSDYSFIGHYRANETIVWKEQLHNFLEEFPEQREPYVADHHKFIGWLIEHGRITKLEVQQVHIGSYGCFTE